MGAIWNKFEPKIVNNTGFPMSFSPISLTHGRYEEVTNRIAPNTRATPAMKVWSLNDSVQGVEGSNKYTFSNGMSLILEFTCPNTLDSGGGSRVAGLEGANAGGFAVTTTPNQDHISGGCCSYTTWSPTYAIDAV